MNNTYDDQKASDDKLREITGVGVGEEDQMQAAAHAGAKEDLAQRENDTPVASASPTDTDSIKKAEENPWGPPPKVNPENQSDGEPLYRGDGKKGEAGNPQQDKRGIRSLFASRKKRLLLGIGIAGAGGIAALLLNLGSLLLPTISFNMDDNRLKRVTRNIMVNTDTIIKLKLTLDSTRDPQYRAMLDTYSSGRSGDFFRKVNSLRPNKLAEQLVLDATFDYDNRVIPGTNITRQRIASVTYGGLTAHIPENNFNFGQRVMHPVNYINSLFHYWRDTRALTKNFLRELDSDPSRVKRIFQNLTVVGQAAKEVRTNLDNNKRRWTLADIQRAEQERPTRQEAHIQETITTNRQTTNDGARPLVMATRSGDTAAEEEQRKQDACMREASCVSRVIQDGDGISRDVKESVSTRFSPTVMRTVINSVGMTTDFGYLLCLANGGSISTAKDVINGNSNMAQAGYMSASSAASQQIYTGHHDGDKRVDQALTGGLNDQMNAEGGAAQSNIVRRANGQEYSTADTLSPQASAAGMHGTDAFGFLPSPLQSALNSAVGQGYCATVSSTVGAGAIAFGEILLSAVASAFTGGAGGAGLQVAGRAGSQFVVKQIGREFANILRQQFTSRGIARTLAFASAAELTSYLAQATTLQRMGAGFNGAAQGAEILNQWDAGATLFAQDVDRMQNASRPLTTPEYLAADEREEALRLASLHEQGFMERTFALSNPQSLMRRVAITGYSSLRLENIGNNVQHMAAVFNPSTMFAKLPFFGSATADADSTPILSKEYGIVQWGWTIEEEEAYVGDPEFSPLYNELQLDQSGRHGELIDRYGKCFDPIDGGTMGELLAEGHIYRDDDANVVAGRGGDCDPDKLGALNAERAESYNNTYQLGSLTFKDEEAALVFRMRVSIRNHNAIDQLLTIQDPSSDNVAGVSSTGLVNADGYAFPMAPGTQRDYVTLPCTPDRYTAPGACHHDGTPAFDLFFGPSGATDGLPVRAISDGEIVRLSRYGGVAGCYSIQFRSALDNHYYWYGHLQNPLVHEGQTVSAGHQIAEVARYALGSACRGGRDHLHIDRGCVVNGVPQTGGRMSCRDPHFVEFMNDMWNRLPQATDGAIQ